MFNAQHACTQGITVLALCVCVLRVHFTFTYQIWHTSWFFASFELADFEKKPSLQTTSAFHGYFVVFS